ncbi:MAG: type II secretion system F family protein [archaeon]
MFEGIGSLLPRSFLDWVSRELTFAGLKYDKESFVGFILILSILLAIIAGFISYEIIKLVPLYSLAVFFTSFIIVFIVPILWISNIADSRGKKVESILPDALQLISSNIKAGQTTERSLFISARKEFGALSDALKETSKRVMVGDRLEWALLNIPKKIKSKVLERTMWLIAEGIKNGGQISNLLIQMSNDLREENALKAEVNSNTSMYVMLIFFSAALGAPMLLGVSSFIVGVLSEQSANIHISPELTSEYASKNPALGLIGIPSSNISENFIVFFSLVDLVITSIFAAMVLGVINSGSEKAGSKYLPVLLIVSIVLFFVVRILAKTFLGGFAL